MKNFKEAYKKAADSIRIPDITAEAVMKEEHRKKIAAFRRRRQFTAVASAACIFLLCTAGVAAAAGYARSIITVDENGFKTADIRTAAERGTGAAEAAYDTALMAEGTEQTITESEADNAALVAEEAEKTIAESVEDMAQLSVQEEAVIEEETVEQEEYTSLQAFEAAEDKPVALPKEAGSGKTVAESYTVCGDMLFVRIETEKGIIMMDQMYYGETNGHASSTVYPGGVCNERSYTTGQGFTYKVIDSVHTEGRPADIHAAVSVGDYELIVNFIGYMEEEAFAVLEELDLTVYLP